MRFPWLPVLMIFLIEALTRLQEHHLCQREAKKCGYDCSQCRAWSCEAKTCNKKRMEDEV